MAAFITPGPVQIVAAVLFAAGIAGLTLSHKLPRAALTTVGVGAFLATLAVLTAYATSIRPSDGRAAWRSLDRLFQTSFYDSWPYVFVVAAAATILWTVVTRLNAGRWEVRSSLPIGVGATAAAVLVKLLGSV